MHLACLMAGSSSRLLPHTADRHKATLTVGDRSLLERQLDLFAASGIEHYTFVLGHGGLGVAQILFERLATHHFEIRYNPLYSTLNLDRSAQLALAGDADVLYYEGDLLVPSSLLRDLAQNPAEIAIA